MTDFASKGWPVLVLWVVMVTLEIAARPTPRQPAPDRLLYGALPAFGFIATAIAVLITQGHW
jgi:hypothetical protein